VLLAAAAIALVVWVVSWFRAPTPWSPPPPGRAGRNRQARRCRRTLPADAANAASVRRTALVRALTQSESVQQFVTREIARGELTIGKPPALPDVSAISELLLREPVVWTRRVAFDDAEARQCARCS
jgi:hypothetical protein